MSKIYRFIQAQGSLDGACFLYSLANATQNLIGEQISVASWAKMAKAVYNPQDYLVNCIGTAYTDDNSVLQEALAQQYLDFLSPKLKLQAKTIHSLRDGSNPERFLTEKSLLIVQNNEHWFCLLDACDNDAYVACSWVWQRDLQDYREDRSPGLNRIYNDKFPIRDLVYFESRAIEISVA